MLTLHKLHVSGLDLDPPLEFVVGDGSIPTRFQVGMAYDVELVFRAHHPQGLGEELVVPPPIEFSLVRRVVVLDNSPVTIAGSPVETERPLPRKEVEA